MPDDDPRQQALDGLNAERFGLSPTRQPISEPANVGPGPSASLVARAREANRQRRARVLAHPDLAARLTQPPLSYKQPEQWSGYVPPEQYGGSHNDSQRRTALVEIMREVADRELAAAAARSEDDEPSTQRPAQPDPVWDFDPPEHEEDD